MTSACIRPPKAFTEFCKGSGWATLVGEHTGGGNDAFTPAMVTLPNSKIPIFFAVGMGLNPDFSAVEEASRHLTYFVRRGYFRSLENID